MPAAAPYVVISLHKLTGFNRPVKPASPLLLVYPFAFSPLLLIALPLTPHVSFCCPLPRARCLSLETHDKVIAEELYQLIRELAKMEKE